MISNSVREGRFDGSSDERRGFIMHVMIIKVKKKIQEDYCLTLLDKNIDGHFYPLERSQKVIGKW